MGVEFTRVTTINTKSIAVQYAKDGDIAGNVQETFQKHPVPSSMITFVSRWSSDYCHSTLWAPIDLIGSPRVQATYAGASDNTLLTRVDERQVSSAAAVVDLESISLSLKLKFTLDLPATNLRSLEAALEKSKDGGEDRQR